MSDLFSNAVAPGSSTGVAAALVAAAWQKEAIPAVMSRGGRPDLAAPELALVTAPTLLVAGGADHGVIELNEAAAEKLVCDIRVAPIPVATHLSDETGTLDKVVDLAADWLSHFQNDRTDG